MIDEIIVRHSDEIIMIFNKDELLQLPPKILNQGIQRGQKLKEKLNELFDSSIPFRQTVNIDNCKYCSFKGICQR